jgi:hypothetical protein
MAASSRQQGEWFEGFLFLGNHLKVRLKSFCRIQQLWKAGG